MLDTYGEQWTIYLVKPNLKLNSTFPKMITMPISARNNDSNQYAFDPLPTWLLKEVVINIAHNITTSFTFIYRGIFSADMEACYFSNFIPLLKKVGLTSYHNQSIVQFEIYHSFGKSSNRLSPSQLISYLNEFHLLPNAQSAYRQCHSTKTAVWEIFSDIIHAAIAKSNIVFSLLLYL